MEEKQQQGSKPNLLAQKLAGAGGAIIGAAAPKKKKDPFVGYSARRTSVNPADGMSVIDKIMTQQRVVKTIKASQRDHKDIMANILRMSSVSERSSAENSPVPGGRSIRASRGERSPRRTPRKSMSPKMSPKAGARGVGGGTGSEPLSPDSELTQQIIGAVSNVADVTQYAAESAARVSGMKKKGKKAGGGAAGAAGAGGAGGRQPTVKEQQQAKKQKMLDMILPSVLGNPDKKRKAMQRRLLKQKREREEQLARSLEEMKAADAAERKRQTKAEQKQRRQQKKMSRTEPHPEVDSDDEFGDMSMMSRSSLPGLRRQPQQQEWKEPANPYTLSAKPSKYTQPSENEKKLEALRHRQTKHKQAFKAQEEEKVVRRKEQARAKKFQSVEEAKLWHGRQRLERQGEQLLNPVKRGSVAGKGGGGGGAGGQAAAQKMQETYMLLDVMDDLLLQISVLKSRLDELQENTTTDVEREENDELLDCLAITSGHIAKHKDVIESGQVLGPKGGRRPNHISILQSAQTWKITLLTVVDTLAKRQREAAIDGQIEQMDFGEMEMERERDESPAKKASDSVIDGIHDSETRQRLLLRIGSGMD
ncbi:hypothetical protein TeGR_g2724, partial [Tetraparma gracilis]